MQFEKIADMYLFGSKFEAFKSLVFAKNQKGSL